VFGAVYRQIPRGVSGAVLAFVTRVVFFIDHDQPQPWQAGKHRHARAQDDARMAQVRRQPAAEALRGRHPAVQTHHRSRAQQRLKALAKARFKLGRQVDLRHHHQNLCPRRLQGRFGRAQIDLGFAAAGRPKQERRLLRMRQAIQDVRLFGTELGSRQGLGCMGRGGLCRVFLQAARQLHFVQVLERGGQRAHGHFAQAALVIAGGELHQLQPLGIQGGQTDQHGVHRLGLRFAQIAWGVVGAVLHDTHDGSLTQGHPDQGPGGKRMLTSVAQGSAHPAVGGRGNDDAGPMCHLRKCFSVLALKVGVSH